MSQTGHCCGQGIWLKEQDIVARSSIPLSSLVEMKNGIPSKGRSLRQTTASRTEQCYHHKKNDESLHCPIHVFIIVIKWVWGYQKIKCNLNYVPWRAQLKKELWHNHTCICHCSGKGWSIFPAYIDKPIRHIGTEKTKTSHVQLSKPV